MKKNIKKPSKYKSVLKHKIKTRPKTPHQMRVKGEFLLKNFDGNLNDNDFVNSKGHYTARAWRAWEVGERPPKSAIQAKLLVQKGRRLLDRVFRLEATAS